MEKVLFAADELTGLIWAAALMRPSKSTKDMELKSLKKKYKSKGFAAGCSREVIERGAQQLGWELEKLLTMTLQAMAASEDTINAELLVKCVIGIGTVVPQLKDLSRSLKEAQVAIEVGRVFDADKTIINYENLGIGRLIYQLPTTLCEMFLQEVFKKNPIDALDKETLFTINKFFENNLILSETARKLFVHRNTLVYRLEKIKKLTGLDLREFDDAITFKVALMVKKYLASRGIEA